MSRGPRDFRSPKTYGIDELKRKHEGYPYDDSDAHSLNVEYEGRSLGLLLPEFVPHPAVKATASMGDLWFRVGEQLDEEDADGTVIEAADSVVMVAR
jgi:hypothetical protein